MMRENFLVWNNFNPSAERYDLTDERKVSHALIVKPNWMDERKVFFRQSIILNSSIELTETQWSESALYYAIATSPTVGGSLTGESFVSSKERWWENWWAKIFSRQFGTFQSSSKLTGESFVCLKTTMMGELMAESFLPSIRYFHMKYQTDGWKFCHVKTTMMGGAFLPSIREIELTVQGFGWPTKEVIDGRKFSPVNQEVSPNWRLKLLFRRGNRRENRR